MLLRPRQKEFVDRTLEALKLNGNALGVAPTGAGKTILFSEVIGRHLAGNSLKALVLAHRDELTDQNRSKFSLVNPSIATSIYEDHQQKRWLHQYLRPIFPRSLPASGLWPNLLLLPAKAVYGQYLHHHPSPSSA